MRYLLVLFRRMRVFGALLTSAVVVARASAANGADTGLPLKLTSALNAAEEALAAYEQISKNDLEKAQEQISNARKSVDSVQEKAESVIQLQKQRDALIHDINAEQVQLLIADLNQVAAQEQARRAAKKDTDAGSKIVMDEDKILPPDWKEQLDP